MEASYDVLRLWEAADKQSFIAGHAGSIRAIATRGDLGATAELIAALPNLEMIGCFGVGTDAIDLAAAHRHGVKVSNTPDVLTGDVADLAIALCLAVTRKIPASDHFLRKGDWKTETMPLTSRFFGKRIGIIGLGRIGLAIARRAAGFDMEIAYHNRSKRDDSSYEYCATAMELAAKSDYLVAAVAGGTASKSLINSEVLHALGPEGYFINVARGSVVDEDALLLALQKSDIKGAGLDVYLNEPNIDERFSKLANVVLLPHIGSATLETRQAMGQLVRDNLAAHFAGRALLTPVMP